MEQKTPLCTVFITYYNNGDVFYETVDSVLAQDYPNLELIISDDASARVPLPLEKAERYVRERMGDNVKNLVIRANEKNLGTVRHVELIRALSSGEYCCGIAGDDLFGDAHVISAMVERFEELGPQAEYMIGQVEMFDQKMERSYGGCVQKHMIHLLKEENWRAILDQEYEGCKLVGQCMLRRSLLQRLPKLSESYSLVEDYSLHMWLLHAGIPIYWCDIVMVKHRGGGVSHGNVSNSPQAYAAYCRDYMTVFELEIRPYQHEMVPQTYRQAYKSYRFFTNEYETALKIAAHPFVCRLLCIRSSKDLKDRQRLVTEANTLSNFAKAGGGAAAALFNALLLCLLPGWTGTEELRLFWAILRVVNAMLLVGMFGTLLFLCAGFLAYRLYRCFRLLRPTYY